jgi:hypothetical protein
MVCREFAPVGVIAIMSAAVIAVIYRGRAH